MKILLVEDEEHKRDEILTCIAECQKPAPEVVDSVNTAVLRVLDENYDLIVLDMALSTFGENSDDRKKGHDQAQGGIEVLRALKSKQKFTKIIIVTQYPDFYIGGTRVKLKDSPKVIREKYGQNVIGAVSYVYKSKSTLQSIKSLLRKV